MKEKEKKRLKQEIVFLLCCILFLVILIAASIGLPKSTVRLPLLVAWVTFAFSVIQIGYNLLILNRSKNIQEDPAGKKSEAEIAQAKAKKRKELIQVVWGVGFMFLTLILWYLLGFLPGTIISCCLFGYYLGEKKISRLLLVTVCSSVMVFLLFSMVLNIPLRNGILFGGYWG